MLMPHCWLSFGGLIKSLSVNYFEHDIVETVIMVQIRPPEAATLFHVGVSLVETLLRKGVVKRRPYKTE